MRLVSERLPHYNGGWFLSLVPAGAAAGQVNGARPDTAQESFVRSSRSRGSAGYEITGSTSTCCDVISDVGGMEFHAGAGCKPCSGNGWGDADAACGGEAKPAEAPVERQGEV